MTGRPAIFEFLGRADQQVKLRLDTEAAHLELAVDPAQVLSLKGESPPAGWTSQSRGGGSCERRRLSQLLDKKLQTPWACDHPARYGDVGRCSRRARPRSWVAGPAAFPPSGRQ